ncbi:hypothetical protein IAW_05835 [Bacillus cereus str. Schrouff]|nr:hypothetical protein IAW_05835 [Bacillus cereus str. Schrouff]EOO81650.1 hypothetical protein IGY_05672 [Bacillus cereus K-5975c]
MNLSIDYNHLTMGDCLKLSVHYKLPLKRQRRLIENKFVFIDALMKQSSK